ncbi:MAG: ribosome small subunit-dependent GTPase A [Erysipelotrichaceae bacterium]|jgi:ribosome biogenesis GTPase|nr:ribosome small subunit-dependent GTPase A [Erysipelotrichaceae bacterium]
MKGLVVASSFGTYAVSVNGTLFYIKPRGAFRQQGIKPMVGDYVEFDEIDLVMNDVFPRSTILKRPAIANITQLVLVFSLVEPDFSYLLAFKYLTYANMHNLKVSLVITKIDKNENIKLVEQIKSTFESLNIHVYFISNKTKEGLDEVKKLFKNEVSCIMGQTGVGKSSLINAIDTNYARAIGEYSKALGRGKHRTKEVILLPYQGGYIADTPGFSALDLELSKEELAVFYPSFNTLYNKCYFANCLHLSENRCAVKHYLSSHTIPSLVYEIYQKLSLDAPYKIKRY